MIRRILELLFVIVAAWVLIFGLLYMVMTGPDHSGESAGQARMVERKEN